MSPIHHDLEGLPSVYFLDLSLSLIHIGPVSSAVLAREYHGGGGLLVLASNEETDDLEILNGNCIAHIRFDDLNMNDFIGVRNYSRVPIFFILCWYGGWNFFF